MLRVKIFASSTQINEVSVLEEDINHWLMNEQPVIRQMIQSCSAGQVVLTFLFDEAYRQPSASDASAMMHGDFDQGSDNADADSTDDGLDMLPDAELPY